MKIQGSVAVVTGGASGIGKAICQALAAEGAKVCIIDINAAQGRTFADELKHAHGEENILFARADVTSQEELEGVFDDAKDTLGPLDIVINNAGIVDEINWRSCVNVNLMGVISGTRLAVDYMSGKNGGSGGVIISTASVSGLVPEQYHFLPTYGATKAAVIAHTLSWSANPRCQREGIRINAVCPEGVNTPIVDVLKHPELLIDMSEELTRAFDRDLETMKPSRVAEVVMELILDDTKNGAIIHLTAEKAQQVRLECPDMINSFCTTVSASSELAIGHEK
uniref:15-hydroxyprostaglandin dehydrogenase [NAD(+)] n=1 Tax=Leptochiton asellus TaxID=211853 RepID=A0A8D7ZGB5_9MOLL|nr:Retinal Dehydrogenase D (RDH-D) [Leptochiton asellus]